MTSPEVHSWTEVGETAGDQVAFTYWPGTREVRVAVLGPDGQAAVADVPWPDFQRMTESMYQAWRDAQGLEME